MCVCVRVCVHMYVCVYTLQPVLYYLVVSKGALADTPSTDVPTAAQLAWPEQEKSPGALHSRSPLCLVLSTDILQIKFLMNIHYLYGKGNIIKLL